MTPPALPPSSGPNPARAAFLREVAAALEFLALWHSIPAEDQEELRGWITERAVMAETEPNRRKKK